MTRPRAATVAGIALIAGAFVALIGVSLSSAVVYYMTPTELARDASGSAVRLYGLVEPGSVRWDRESSAVSFRVTDGTTTTSVVSESLPTGLFRDGVGVVLAGRVLSSGVFAADEILVKHSEVYAPLAPGETVPPGVLDTVRGATP